MVKVVIMGASGDGLVVAQAVKDIEHYDGSMRVVGFLDDAFTKGDIVSGVEVLGGLASWKLQAQDVKFYPALHKVKKMFLRKELIKGLGVPDERWCNVIHPTATIAQDVILGHAVFIASHVTFQPRSSCASFSSVRAGANLGHDSVVSSYCYIGPNATLCGGVMMKEGAHLGPNGVIIDGMVAGAYCIIGAGSVATKNINEFDVCLGNPARKVSSVAGSVKKFQGESYDE